MLDKLAAYEAAKLSTQPLYDKWSQSYVQDLLGNPEIIRLMQPGVWKMPEIKVFNSMSAVKRPGRFIVARKC